MKTDSEILQQATFDFAEKFPAKFTRGMAQYKTPITEKDCLAELGQELLDAWAYYQAEKARLAHVLELVKNAMFAYDNDAPYAGQDQLRQVIDILSPKPLATKKPTEVGETEQRVKDTSAIYYSVDMPTEENRKRIWFNMTDGKYYGWNQKEQNWGLLKQMQSFTSEQP